MPGKLITRLRWWLYLTKLGRSIARWLYAELSSRPFNRQARRSIGRTLGEKVVAELSNRGVR